VASAGPLTLGNHPSTSGVFGAGLYSGVTGALVQPGPFGNRAGSKGEGPLGVSGAAIAGGIVAPGPGVGCTIANIEGGIVAPVAGHIVVLPGVGIVVPGAANIEGGIAKPGAGVVPGAANSIEGGIAKPGAGVVPGAANNIEGGIAKPGAGVVPGAANNIEGGVIAPGVSSVAPGAANIEGCIAKPGMDIIGCIPGVVGAPSACFGAPAGKELAAPASKDVVAPAVDVLGIVRCAGERDLEALRPLPRLTFTLQFLKMIGIFGSKRPDIVWALSPILELGFVKNMRKF
jgi:hypothetical protein